MEPVDDDSIRVGIVVSNNGTQTLTGVQLIEQLLEGVIVEQIDQPTCAKTGNNIICGLGSLVRGSSAEVSFTVQTDERNPLLGRTVVRSNQGDTVLTDPYIVKIVAPPFARPGDTVEWTIFLINPGAEAVQNVTVVDTLPSALEVLNAEVSSGTVNVSRNRVVYRTNSLSPVASVTISVTTRLRLDAERTPIINNQACLTTADQTTPSCISAPLFQVSQLPTTGEKPQSRTHIIGLFATAMTIIGGLLLIEVRRRFFTD